MFPDPLILYGFSTGKIWFSFHGRTSSLLHSLPNEPPGTIAQSQRVQHHLASLCKQGDMVGLPLTLCFWPHDLWAGTEADCSGAFLH